MGLQQTISTEFSLYGKDSYSGRRAIAYCFPAEPGSGITFETPDGNIIKASLANAKASRRSLLLSGERSSVIQMEHFLATLYAYGIDNLHVRVSNMRKFSGDEWKRRLSYDTHNFFNRLGISSPYVFPNSWDDRESVLCSILDQKGMIEAQEAERKLITPEDIGSVFGDSRLSFYPYESPGLAMYAITDYHPVGIQKFFLDINAKNYRSELAESRPFASPLKYLQVLPDKVAFKFASAVAALWYPSFGIDHAHTENNIFLPKKNVREWKDQERMEAELARHTIVDRLGAIALLGARLDHIFCKMNRSSHRHDLEILERLLLRIEEKK